MTRLSLSISTETVSTDAGHFVVLGNRNDRTGNHVRNNDGEWMRSLIDRYADKDNIALDVGSSFGIHSAYMSGKFKSVIAFEPQRVIAELSERTFFLNGMVNIEVVNAACSDETEEARIPVIDYNITKNAGGVSMAYSEDGDPNTNSGWDGVSYTRTRSVIIDDMLSESFGNESVGFIKIDVEGFEYRALKGAEKTLRKFLSPLAIEIRDFPAGNLQKVHGLLSGIGYRNSIHVGKSTWDYLYTGSSDDMP